MTTSSPVRIVCPHCGFMEVYFNPSRFPVCECCGYEDPVIINDKEYSEFYDAKNNDMLKYSEEKKRRIQEEHDRNFKAPHCPKCGCAEFQMVPRKWSLFTGFATNKVDRVCVRCKTKF